MDLEQNPYTCLGLLPGSSAADVKRRYRQLAKKYHPDAQGKAASEEMLRVLNAAYAFLSDPAKKSAFDVAFAARNAVFNPARMPQPVRMPRRLGPSLPAMLALTLLFLSSAGVGVLFSQQNPALLLSSLYSRFSSKTAGPDRPPPSYTFLPSHGAFDDNSTPPAPNISTQAGAPTPASLP